MLLTEALRYLIIAYRGSQITQGGSQRLSNTSEWLTEALRHRKVAHRGSQIPQGYSQKLLDTSG